MGKSSFIFLISLFWWQSSVAQKNRYVVYLSDKDASAFSIDRPEEYLSVRAIQRRINQGIGITSQDLPVNRNYLDSLMKYGADPYFESKWLNAVLVEATQEVIDILADQVYIVGWEFAAPGQKLNGVLEDENRAYTPNELPDSEYNSNRQLVMLGAQSMHNEDVNGAGIWIAVFDAGFTGANESIVFQPVFSDDRLHDLKDFTTGGQNVFQYNGHGTNAWSCIAADYQGQMTGTGYGADFSLYVTEDTGEYRIEEYNWLFAAEHADSAGVDIISSSLGYMTFDDPTMDYSYEDSDGQTAIVSMAAQLVSNRGILVVTSAGNSGNSSTSPYIAMPADGVDVLSVGAVDVNYQKAGFSSIGPSIDNRIKPEVVALGQGVALLDESNELNLKSGTSFSAPLIAGLAAGLWQKNPNLTNLKLKEWILSAASQYNDPDNLLGYGWPNYDVAVGNAPLAIEILDDKSIRIFPNPVEGTFFKVKLDHKISFFNIQFNLYDPNGKLVSTKSVGKIRRSDTLEIPFESSVKGIYVLNIISRDFVKNAKIVRF